MDNATATYKNGRCISCNELYGEFHRIYCIWNTNGIGLRKETKIIMTEPKGREVRTHESEEIEQVGGFQRSKKPKYGLIPTSAMVALANRMELGQYKHGPNAWNAGTSTIDRSDKEWALVALEHTINHCLTARDKLLGIIDDNGDDDAGAILFGGAVLAECYKNWDGVNPDRQQKGNPAEEGGEPKRDYRIRRTSADD